MTALEGLGPWAIAALLILVAVLVLRRPLGRLVKLGLRSCGALAFLAVLQKFGGALGLALGVNPFNAVVLAVLGAPGFGLLLMLQWVLQ